MIEEYFQKVENVLRDFPGIRSYMLGKKIYNSRQGMIGGKVIFENEHSLEFTEVMDTEQDSKIKYRYHYMNEKQNLIFCYDNAHHHPQVNSFPHHKHTETNVQSSEEPDLSRVLFEIMHYLKK